MTDLLADVLADEPALPAPPAPPGRRELAFAVKRFVFLLLLERAGHVVPSREINPVLKNVKVDVAEGRLQVAATDLELSILASTELVETDVGGCAVFPAKRMTEIVREAAEDTVVVEVVDGTATITVARATWQLRLAGGAAYPALPDVAEAALYEVERVALLHGLVAVRYAAAREATRSSLMMIDVRDAAMTACDGVRLAQARIPALPVDMAIPIGAVDDLIKLLRASDLSNVRVGTSVNHLIFGIGADVLIANKLTAAAPDMQAQLLRPAQANTARLVVAKTDLVDAVRQVRITADPTTSAIGLHLHPGSEPSVRVVARDTYANTATATIDADWTGGERTVVVNHVFLLDLIGAHPGPTLHFYLGEHHPTRPAPLLLRDDEAGTVGVIQQMRADWVGQ